MVLTLQKGFAHIGLVIAILVIGVGGLGYYMLKNGQVQNKNVLELEVTPTGTLNKYISPTETLAPTKAGEAANWKTYTDSKYKFSFEYPAQYLVATSTEIPGANPYSVFIWTDTSKEELLVAFKFDDARTNALNDYGEQKTLNPSEYPLMKVGTKDYPTTKFLFGEGVPSYGDCISSGETIRYLTDINANMVVELMRLKQTDCNEDGTSKVTKEITDIEFNAGKQILATFTQ